MRKKFKKNTTLSWKDKMVIVSAYRRYGHLNIDVCRKIGRKLKRDYHYIMTCKDRKWFSEFVEIWDFVQQVRKREREETIRDYEREIVKSS